MSTDSQKLSPLEIHHLTLPILKERDVMGTSMKAYIEFECSGVAPPFTDAMQILSLTEGAFSLSRDYLVFDALAGGRQARMAPEDQNPDNTPKYAQEACPFLRALRLLKTFFVLLRTRNTLRTPIFGQLTVASPRLRLANGCVKASASSPP